MHALAFKQTWHLGDLQPDGYEHHLELGKMVDAMDKFVMSKITPGPFELAKFMKMADHFFEERRVVDDCFRAYAAIAMFFDTEDFLASRQGEPFKESKLLKQAERARDLPDRRTHNSVKTRPKEFWDEWDRLSKHTEEDDTCEDIFPMEWRKAIRPVVIRCK